MEQKTSPQTFRAQRLAMIRAAAEPAPPPTTRTQAPQRPASKRRGVLPCVLPRYDGPHRALPNWNFAVLRGH